MPKAQINKIVVRGTNWVGDAVMTIPAMRELRKIFPNAHISLHTRFWARGIFQDAEFIDEILPFEPEKYTIQTVLREAKIWRGKKFDLAVLFPNSFEAALLAQLGNVSKRFGYAKEGRSFLLTDAVKIPVWKNERHEVFYYLNLVREIEKTLLGTQTVLVEKSGFELKVSNERKSEARRFLNENKVDLSKKIFAFVAGSTNSRAKRWQTESFARLNDKIQSELKANVILLGSKEETQVAAEVSALSKLKPVNLTGKTNLAEATAILSLCDFTVSNDTGTAHVSAALGTKTLVIFGPTNPLTTQPLGAEIIRKNVECAPCMLRDCPIDHRCMTKISAGEVFEKILSML